MTSSQTKRNQTQCGSGTLRTPRNFQRKILNADGFVEDPGHTIRGRGDPAKVIRAGPATTLHPAVLRR